jgi:hypothetical protein
MRKTRKTVRVRGLTARHVPSLPCCCGGGSPLGSSYDPRIVSPPRFKKVLQQKARRSDSKARDMQIVASEAQATMAQAAAALSTAADGVLQFRRGSSSHALSSQRPGMKTHSQQLTFPSVMRIALSPTNVGLRALQSLVFGGQVSLTTIQSARRRVAFCLAGLSWKQGRAKIMDFCKPSEGDACKVLAIRWKFDSTPHPTVVKVIALVCLLSPRLSSNGKCEAVFVAVVVGWRRCSSALPS